jgi:hypothetical protein
MSRVELLIERGFKRRQRVAQDSKHSLEEVNRVIDRFRLTREAFSCTGTYSFIFLTKPNWALFLSHERT